MTATLPLGFAPMDEVHEEFDAILVAALSAPAGSPLDNHLDIISRHLREHFETEEMWMRQSNFPHGACHIDEHAAVLKTAHEIAALTDASTRTRVSRLFFSQLAQWFPAHAQHLDSALTHWLCAERHGGAPVVIHRKSFRLSEITT